MTDESSIYILESPVFLRVDMQELRKLDGFHPVKKLSKTTLHIATKVRGYIDPHTGLVQEPKYYKMLGSEEFYHERFFRIVKDTSVN